MKLESVLKVHLLRNTQIKHEFSKQEFPSCMFSVWGNLGLRDFVDNCFIFGGNFCIVYIEIKAWSRAVCFLLNPLLLDISAGLHQWEFARWFRGQNFKISRLLIGGSGFRIRHSIGGILHNFQETNERLN